MNMTSLDGCACHLGAHHATIQAAGAIAVRDTAERLLGILFAAYPPVYLEGVFDKGECLVKAAKVAQELRDYAAIAGIHPEKVVEDAAATCLPEVEWRQAIAEAMSLVGRRGM